MCVCVCVCVCVCAHQTCTTGKRKVFPHNSLCCAEGDISVGLHVIAEAVTAVVRGQQMNEFSFIVAHWGKTVAMNPSGGAL